MWLPCPLCAGLPPGTLFISSLFFIGATLRPRLGPWTMLWHELRCSRTLDLGPLHLRRTDSLALSRHRRIPSITWGRSSSRPSDIFAGHFPMDFPIAILGEGDVSLWPHEQGTSCLSPTISGQTANSAGRNPKWFPHHLVPSLALVGQTLASPGPLQDAWLC